MYRKHAARFRGLWIVILTIAALSSSSSFTYADPVPVTITLANVTGGYQGCTETTLIEDSAQYNFGKADETFWVQKRGSQDRTALIKFSLAGQIPSNACIKSATLRLYQWQTYNMSGDFLDVAVYRCLQDWDEGEGDEPYGLYLGGATWYYRKVGYQDVWNAYGARGADTDRHATPDAVTRCTETNGWKEWDVTPSVHYWHSHPDANHGLALDWTEVGITTAGVNFRPSEWGDNHPELVITYVIPEAEPSIALCVSDLNLNFWNSDGNVTAVGSGTARHVLSGTTAAAGWGWDGSATNGTYNTSFDCSIKVKLEDGIVSHNNGNYALKMWVNGTNYIQLQAVYAGFYEISGYCPAVGNGERHDGSAYWNSYADDDTSGVRYYSQTPENEETDYLTWTLRYEKTNQMFYVYVNGTLVTYYSGINLSNWRLALVHANDLNAVATTVRTQLHQETAPPIPNPLTWVTPPYALNTSAIAMTSTTASDVDSPPVEYSFEETTGHAGGTNSGWQASTSYSDSGLSENMQYGYHVRSRDSMVPPNVGGYSSTILRYTLIAPPNGLLTSNITTSTINLTAVGSLPNLTSGSSGLYFSCPAAGGLNEWVQSATDQATSLSTNTQYTFAAKARNGDGAETAYCIPISRYSAMPPPTGITASNVTATTADLAAQGSLPNLTEGESGVFFSCPGVPGINEWVQSTTDQATGLTPNSAYIFAVKARNGDRLETTYAPTPARIRTLAATPVALPYGIGTHTIQANWGANGNPPGTKYLCTEETTGKHSEWIAATSWSLSPLEPNQVYRFYVKAMNDDSIETAEIDLGTVSPLIGIGMVKRDYRIGDSVALSRKLVTAVFNDLGMFFIQDEPLYGCEEGSAGIAIKMPVPCPPLIVGDVVNMDGLLLTNGMPYEKELMVKAANVTPVGHLPSVQTYLGIIRALGGGDYGVQEAVADEASVDPPMMSVAPNTIGRLVTVVGAFDDGGLGGVSRFWVNDGSPVNDGTCTGIAVDLTELGGILVPPLPAFCAVTGILRCMMVDTPSGRVNVRTLWPRISDDIVTYY